MFATEYHLQLPLSGGKVKYSTFGRVQSFDIIGVTKKEPTMRFKLFLTLITLSFSIPSFAQIFNLDFDCTNAGICAALESSIQAEVQKAEDKANDGLPKASPDRLMEGMANSSVMAGKGIGSDYASNMSVLLIGAGVGVGADLEESQTGDDGESTPLSGVGIQGGLLIGTNLSWMDTQKILGLETNRLNVYVNFFKYSHEQKMGGEDKQITADLASFGLHVSYDWIPGSKSKLLGWGGVKLHLGLEKNTTEIEFQTTIDETVTATQGTETATSTVNGTPKATIDVNTLSIPLEISTSVQMLYILSLYGGLGVDYNMGYAEGKGALNAAPAAVNCTGVACGGGTQIGTITPTANIDAKSKVDPFLTRGFLGVQFNLPFTRIFVQADKSFGNDLVGAHAGLRFVF